MTKIDKCIQPLIISFIIGIFSVCPQASIQAQPYEGEMNTLVLPVYFNSPYGQPRDIDISDIDYMFFQLPDDPDNTIEPLYTLKQIFEESSYGKFTIVGAVVPEWMYLDLDGSCGKEFFSPMGQAAIDKAEQDYGFNPADFEKFVVIHPVPCAGEVLGVGNNTMFIYSEVYDTPRHITHEYGHMMGLYHAKRYDCDNDTDIWRPDCRIIKYGDRSDPMGSGNGHFKPGTKKAFGWLEQGKHIITATQDGDYTIHPYAENSDELKVLHLISGSGVPLFSHFKQPILFEQHMMEGVNGEHGYIDFHVFDGAFVHRSYLLDTHPGEDEQDGSQATLLEGMSITDPTTGAVITNVKTNRDTENPRNSTLTLNVQLGKDDFEGPVTTSLTPQEDETIAGIYIFSADAVDVSGIEKLELYINNNLFATIEAVDKDQTYFETSIDTTRIYNGLARAQWIGYDRSCEGIEGCIYNNQEFSDSTEFFVDNPDEEPPYAAIHDPSSFRYTTYTNPVFVNGSTRDNVNISRWEVYKDNDPVPIATYEAEDSDDYTFGPSFYYDFSAGHHTVHVTAWDFAGNQATSERVPFKVFGTSSHGPCLPGTGCR